MVLLATTEHTWYLFAAMFKPRVAVDKTMESILARESMCNVNMFLLNNECREVLWARSSMIHKIPCVPGV
jgi:hypothetical protein